jgi:DNA/RNA endonuclease G (NUC1)
VVAKNSVKKTALHLAVPREFWEVAVVLLNAGANVNDLNDQQFHALSGYIQNSSDENKENTLQLLDAFKASNNRY